MTVFQAALLGAIQGLTEFIPISSTAHLWLAQSFMDLGEVDGTAFDIVLHLGTALAVLAVFWRDLFGMAAESVCWALRKPARNPEDRALVLPMIIGTIPGALMGYFLLDFVEPLRSYRMIGATMVIASVIFILAERRGGTRADPTPKDALVVGVAQGLAGLFPGLSRSGVTISTGKALGLSRGRAARFSFLLSFVIILAAGAKTTLDVLTGPVVLPGPAAIVAGFLSAAVFGFLAVRFLISWLKTHTLYPFAIYMAVMGATLVALTFAGVLA